MVTRVRVCVSVFCLDYANLITTCLDKRWIQASDTKRLTGYFSCERERRSQRRLPAQPPQPQQPILPVLEQNKTCLDLIVCNYCAIAIYYTVKRRATFENALQDVLIRLTLSGL